MNFFQQLSNRHEALKKKIHAFRIPLSPSGRRIMGVVYFTLPIIGGYYIMQLAIGQSSGNLGSTDALLNQSEYQGATHSQNKSLQALLDDIKRKQTN